MKLEFISYTITDKILALLLAVLVFFVSFFGTTNYPAWGDDFAAYYNDAIAIAEGTTQEQHELNYIYHPSPLPTEAKDGTLRYVWGYPLLLSLVYRITGFDRVSYTTPAMFKMVSVVALSLAAAVLYLFFRRRFSVFGSALFTLFLCTNSFLLKMLGSQYTDIVYFLFSMLAILLSEIYLDSSITKQKVIFGILLGAALWYTHEVRLNGKMIVGTVAAMLFLSTLDNCLRDKKLKFRALLSSAFPFAVFFVLVFFSETFLFWKATSNMSDISSATVGSFLKMLNVYRYTLRDMLASGISFGLYTYPIPKLLKLIGTVMMLLCLFGAGCSIWKRDIKECCYIGLLTFFFLGASLLPYHQDGRYLVPLLPFVLILIGRGVQVILHLLHGLIAKRHPISKNVKQLLARAANVMIVGYCFATLFFAWRAIDRHEYLYETVYDGPYASGSIEMYHYIMENTDEDALFITCKPRSLYLNTQRMAIPFENGHTLDEADYFLQNINSWLPDYVRNGVISQERLDEMTEVYRTDSFVLYQVHK